ncbi:winged helix-turn-helix domain-containing protein [Streptomyces sp. Ag109_O5-1]|uniref:helix-turn-helix domain-containing protein n=1 Tax=Streptomyces sp. Ag109_O5-1 TaxID=1938851 RepID=UPI00288A76BC|nr:winged helix-turn-helix domain-containing protein [Streptomyces sp. Ag109_O5-1]
MASGVGFGRSASSGLQGAQWRPLQAQCGTTPAPRGRVGRRLAAFGWSDQCWTLSRIAEIVRRRFGVEYTLAGLDLLLHRIGWSVQVPSRKATERNEASPRHPCFRVNPMAAPGRYGWSVADRAVPAGDKE